MKYLSHLALFAFVGLALSQCKVKNPVRSLESEFKKAFFRDPESELIEEIEDHKAQLKRDVDSWTQEIKVNDGSGDRVLDKYPKHQFNKSEFPSQIQQDLSDAWKTYKNNTENHRSEIKARYFSRDDRFKPVGEVSKTEYEGKLAYFFRSNLIREEAQNSGSKRREFFFVYIGWPKSREISRSTDYIRFAIYTRSHEGNSWERFLGYSSGTDKKPLTGKAKGDMIPYLEAQAETAKEENQTITIDSATFRTVYENTIAEIREKFQWEDDKNAGYYRNDPPPLQKNYFSLYPL